MTRIIFVDDDANVLEALHSALRADRQRWGLEFYPGGEEALAAMDVGPPVDIVVSDVVMPRMDGRRFLEVTKATHPSTTRIFLSGHTGDDRQSQSLAAVAHRVIPKPSPTPVIREALERTCDLRALVGDPRLLEAVGGADSLPAAPAILTRLDAALADPSRSVREVAGIVEEDPALSAQVIHLVNSAYFGLPRHITNLAQAVGFLGMQTLRHLALSVCLTDATATTSSERVRIINESVRRRALPTAVLARRIAQDLADPALDDAFLAGLLHDAGILLLTSRLPLYVEVITEATRNHEPLTQAEYRHLGTTHAEIGACLLGLWGITTPVVEAVAHHHHPRRVVTHAFDLPAILHTAQALVLDRGASDDRHPGLDHELVREHGLSDQLATWLSESRTPRRERLTPDEHPRRRSGPGDARPHAH